MQYQFNQDNSETLSPWNSNQVHLIKQLAFASKLKVASQPIKVRIGMIQPKQSKKKLKNMYSGKIPMNTQKRNYQRKNNIIVSSNKNYSKLAYENRVRVKTNFHDFNEKINQFKMKMNSVGTKFHSLRKVSSRFFTKKIKSQQSIDHQLLPLAKPKTPALCKRLNIIIKNQQQTNSSRFLSQRSTLFNIQRQPKKSILQERGQILKKYSHRTIFTFRPSIKQIEINVQKKMKVIKKQRKHLLDKLLSKLQV